MFYLPHLHLITQQEYFNANVFITNCFHISEIYVNNNDIEFESIDSLLLFELIHIDLQANDITFYYVIFEQSQKKYENYLQIT